MPRNMLGDIAMRHIAGATKVVPLAVLGLAVAAAPLPATLDQVAGRYERTFTNSTAEGAPYESTDLVEILPIAGSHSTAVLNLKMNFRNGHSCELSGPARMYGTNLVYVERSRSSELGPCTLRLWRDNDHIRWADNNSCLRNCGMRGSLASGAISYANRRPLTPAEVRARIRTLRNRAF